MSNTNNWLSRITGNRAARRAAQAKARKGAVPQVTQLEDRCNPVNVTFSGTTALLDLNVANEVVTLHTLNATAVEIASNHGVTVDGFVVGNPYGLGGMSGFVITDSAAGTALTFANSAFSYAAGFTVTLDNSPGQVTFNGTSAFGAANSLSVTTARNIVVNLGASVSTDSGNLTLSANQQPTATTGDFVGLDVHGAVTSGMGSVSLAGRGGDGSGGSQVGVRISGSTTTVGTTAAGGSVIVIGQGGASGGGYNSGVTVGGTITSGGGSVTVNGTGGGSGSSSSRNHGVRLVEGFTFLNGSSVPSGAITAGGSGAVRVTGQGGTAAGGNDNYGVTVGGTITSGGGDVTVIGTGGGSGSSSSRNHGVAVISGGTISAGGSGAVRVTGRGGTAAGGSDNHGVFVHGSTDYRGGPIPIVSRIFSSGGSVTVTAVAGGGTNSVAAKVQGFPLYWEKSTGRIESKGNAAVTLIADSVDIADGALSAGTGTVTLRPSTPGTRIDLGGADVLTGSPLTLGLTAAELRRVSAGTLVIGSASADTITLTAPVTRTAVTALQLVTGGDVLATGNGSLDTGGGPLTLTVGGAVVPTPVRNDFTANTVTASAPARLSLAVTGAATNTRLDVVGMVDLTGLSLELTWAYVPAVGEVFTLVSAAGVTGTFNGLPNGAIVIFNRVPLRILYTPTSVSLVATTPPPVVTTIGDTLTVRVPRDNSMNVIVPFPGFLGSVTTASGDLNGDGVFDVVVGAGAGGGPHVKAYDGVTGMELASFFAFDLAFTGGVSVAATNGRIVVGAGPGGGPHVKVIDFARVGERRADGMIADSALLANFFAFDVGFTGGVSVATADVNGDGVPEVVVGAGAGGGPHVKVIDGTRMSEVTGVVTADAALLANVMAFDPTFTGGVSVAASFGRFAVGAGFGVSPRVKVYDGAANETANFLAFDEPFTGGVRVAFTDYDADGQLDLLAAAGPGGGPHLKAFHLSPLAEIASLFVGDVNDPRGVFVA